MAAVQQPIQPARLGAPLPAPFKEKYLPSLLALVGLALIAVGAAAIRGRQSWAPWPRGVPQLMTTAGVVLFVGVLCRGFVRLAEGPELRRAIHNDDPARLFRLINQGADVNESYMGSRPLHNAAGGGLGGNRVAMVRRLLEAGADPNAKTFSDSNGDFNGKTPLMLAAGSGCQPVIRLLLTIPGLELNAQDATGSTALMRAASGRPDYLYLDRGRAYRGHTQAVALLLQAGADATLRNAEGQTALELATALHHQAVVQQLQEVQNEVEAADLSHLSDIPEQLI